MIEAFRETAQSLGPFGWVLGNRSARIPPGWFLLKPTFPTEARRSRPIFGRFFRELSLQSERQGITGWDRTSAITEIRPRFRMFVGVGCVKEILKTTKHNPVWPPGLVIKGVVTLLNGRWVQFSIPFGKYLQSWVQGDQPQFFQLPWLQLSCSVMGHWTSPSKVLQFTGGCHRNRRYWRSTDGYPRTPGGLNIQVNLLLKSCEAGIGSIGKTRRPSARCLLKSCPLGTSQRWGSAQEKTPATFELAIQHHVKREEERTDSRSCLWDCPLTFFDPNQAFDSQNQVGVSKYVDLQIGPNWMV